MQANYSEKEIISLLQKVQIFNRSIGSYEMFAINNSFDYVIKLSNGTIYFKVSELKDDENGTISPETLNQISQRFSNGSNQQQNQNSQQNQQQANHNQNINSQSRSSVNVVVQKQRGFSFGRFLLGFIGIVALIIVVLIIAAVVVVGRMPFF
ncbi:MAG: hypothetical protein A3D31_11440 [Candidatus Fluviicola riflensis]|nr:MAG: hypothetical protein CHH17_15870 [Candidatus Fluviicola riflensis]OGS77603.1 MAG: hypothetical protein A3D31_11440 [Candidatus Fluviicola riflensis]OGS84186.1 MAG: hypothetical protein A3E30_12850 [Fluviicola sp. RIFCSPHIGHO2_12_FULL_43_24]OGS84669.1 MAG: hypothetical protein A2724_08375 [Fluviicola sp. RIFCSPHIGHO2_01_FULL_43_53]